MDCRTFIAGPKTAGFMGRSQFSTLDDQPTVTWLRCLCLDVPGRYLLWPGSRQAFVGYWKTCMDRLGLARHRFTVGSLRPGGATALFLKGVEVARIKFKGRWRSEQALSCYIQEAASTMVWNQISAEAKASLKVWKAHTAFCWSTPPESARSAVFISRSKQKGFGKKKKSKF